MDYLSGVGVVLSIVKEVRLFFSCYYEWDVLFFIEDGVVFVLIIG